MASIYQRLLRFFLFIGCISISLLAPAQKKIGLQVQEWAYALSDGQLNEVNSLGTLIDQLVATDSLHAILFMDSLETAGKKRGYRFRTFFSMVKADVLYAKFASYDKYKDRTAKELLPIKEQIKKLHTDALDAAYHIENDINTGWVSFYSARRMRHFGETAWAVMYSKNGVDLFEKAAYPVEPPVYNDLAELLYQVKEYDESIIYAIKGIHAWKQLNYEKDYPDPYKFKIKAFNTIGNSYYKLNRHDSAGFYYHKALALATQFKDTLLTSKVLGNIGRIIYAQQNFDSAYTLFKADYHNNKLDSIYNEAANASQWMAKASLARGNTSKALSEAKESIRLLELWPNGPYLRDTYHTLTQVYRAMGNYDSAFYYNDRYTALHDSLEKEVATSSLDISKARLNDEVSRFNIQKLNRDKKTELLWRNIIIASIIFISLMALLVVNRKRLKEKLKSESALQEKKLMEQEMNSANEQLKMFTANAIEKANLIEKLESQLKGREATTEQRAIIAELTQQTILTDDDWIKFRALFEKLYPGFFINLKEKFTDITIAEQRMAALTRLRLSTRQIASMLGISVDSVHKSRQRLRQRFQVGTEINLDELVANL